MTKKLMEIKTSCTNILKRRKLPFATDFTFATFSVANIPAYNHDTRVMIEEYSTAKYIVHW